jgi:nucleotide-binding universal stress UspA family protein
MSHAIGRILVPVDFSSCSRAAVTYATELGRRFGATVDLLHVWEPSQQPAPFGVEVRPLGLFVRTRAAREMKTLLAAVEASGVEVHGRLEAGEPARAIVACAEAGGYDLIVVGTRGPRRFGRLLHRRVVDRVVRKTRCPVLSVRADTAS